MSAIPKGLRKCHHPAVSSIVLREAPFMWRAFLADGPSGDRTVAPHSHRTSLRITVLAGRVNHWRFDMHSGGSETVEHYTYRSPLLGGEGLSATCESIQVESWRTPMFRASSFVLTWDEIHTVEWTTDAIWLVQEGPVMTDTTTVLLRPGVDNMDTDGLYEPMSDEEYRERCDLVWRLAAAAGVTP